MGLVDPRRGAGCGRGGGLMGCGVRPGGAGVRQPVAWWDVYARNIEMGRNEAREAINMSDQDTQFPITRRRIERMEAQIEAARAMLAALEALVERGTDSPEHRAAEAAIAQAKAARL